MPNVKKISIALPPEMVAVVRHAVETEEYASSSEVVRDALRDWTQKRSLRRQGIDELRQVWRQAMGRQDPRCSGQGSTGSSGAEVSRFG
jgi:antitoxin ParD1/3/4